MVSFVAGNGEPSTPRTIRELRTARRWSQRHLSHRTGIHVDSIFAHEHLTRVPTVQEMYVYAYALGVTVDDIAPAKAPKAPLKAARHG